MTSCTPLCFLTISGFTLDDVNRRFEWRIARVPCEARFGTHHGKAGSVAAQAGEGARSSAPVRGEPCKCWEFSSSTKMGLFYFVGTFFEGAGKGMTETVVTLWTADFETKTAYTKLRWERTSSHMRKPLETYVSFLPRAACSRPRPSPNE